MDLSLYKRLLKRGYAAGTRWDCCRSSASKLGDGGLRTVSRAISGDARPPEGGLRHRHLPQIVPRGGPPAASKGPQFSRSDEKGTSTQGYPMDKTILHPHDNSMGSATTLDPFDVYEGWVPEAVAAADPFALRRKPAAASALSPESVNPPLRILLVSSAFNGMTQRTKVHLEHSGHLVSVQLFTSADDVQAAVQSFAADVVVCPFLKDFIPASIYSIVTCLVVHPGVMGDRGPSSLDWAISEGQQRWGVTVLQAVEGADAGPVWASVSFDLPKDDVSTKSNIYNTVTADAALQAVEIAVRHCQLVKKQMGYVAPKPEYPVLPQLAAGDTTSHGDSSSTPQLLAAVNHGSWSTGAGWALQLAGQAQGYGCLRDLMQQKDRRIDWSADTTDVIVRKIRAADGQPGVRDDILGLPVFMCGATHEDVLKGTPKEILATRNGAICLGTVDGAVWVSHLRRARAKGSADTHFKLPAVMVLGKDRLDQAGAKELPADIDITGQPQLRTFRDVWYEEVGSVGILHFPIYNGAASTDQLVRLREAYTYARSKASTRVIMLAGGGYCWSNGIHLNVIEASNDPGQEAWNNINAIDDLVRDVVTTDSHITLSAMQGNAGAGGVYLAMAADYVLAHEGVVLNPHYKGMGLFGSEYWTYLSSRRLGSNLAADISDACLPLCASQAWQLGMIDELVSGPRTATLCQAVERAEAFASANHFKQLLAIKRDRRASDEQRKPLEAYRQEELQHMRANMLNNNWGFHEKRKAFVFKHKPVKTCPALPCTAGRLVQQGI